MFKNLIDKIFMKENDDDSYNELSWMYASIEDWKDMCRRRDEEIDQLKKHNTALTDSISRIRQSCEQEKRELRSEVFDIEFDYKQKIKDLTNDFDVEKAEMENTISSQQEEIKDLVNLNSALLRVSREKANADRGIPNKKQHDGYLILIGKDQGTKKTDEAEVPEYKYSIQSPYKASLPFDSVKRQIGMDLKYGSLLPDIGCKGFVDSYRETDACMLYKWTLSMNGKSGYYEADLFFSMPINIPEYRLPPK